MNCEQTASIGPGAQFKVVFLGDSGVGKTSIVERIAYGSFDKCQQATVMLDTVKKDVIHQGRSKRLNLWDTAGQEKFNSLVPSSIRDNDCAVLVYDVSNPESLKNCKHWLKMIDQVNGSGNSVCILVANKIDLNRNVKKQQGFQWALEHKFSYLEASAQTGDGIENVVYEILERIDIHKKKETSTNDSENPSSRALKEERKVVIDERKKTITYRDPTKKSCCSI